MYNKLTEIMAKKSKTKFKKQTLVLDIRYTYIKSKTTNKLFSLNYIE